MKNYYCYWNDSIYYGISAHWADYYGDYDEENISDNVVGRERFILELKGFFKYNDGYQQIYLPASEFMDFIDTLSNNLNGEDLYKNFCENCEYLDSLSSASFKQNIHAKFEELFYPKSEDYSTGCALRIFDKNVNNLLKNPKDFETFVQKTVYDKDEFLYYSLFDAEQSKQNVIKYFKEQIESYNKSIEYYEEQIEDYKKQIKKIEIELEKLK